MDICECVPTHTMVGGRVAMNTQSALCTTAHGTYQRHGKDELHEVAFEVSHVTTDDSSTEHKAITLTQYVISPSSQLTPLWMSHSVLPRHQHTSSGQASTPQAGGTPPAQKHTSTQAHQHTSTVKH